MSPASRLRCDSASLPSTSPSMSLNISLVLDFDRISHSCLNPHGGKENPTASSPLWVLLSLLCAYEVLVCKSFMWPHYGLPVLLVMGMCVVSSYLWQWFALLCTCVVLVFFTSVSNAEFETRVGGWVCSLVIQHVPFHMNHGLSSHNHTHTHKRREYLHINLTLVHTFLQELWWLIPSPTLNTFLLHFSCSLLLDFRFLKKIVRSILLSCM